jgi:DNA-binding PadR family transcriptional regulator
MRRKPGSLLPIEAAILHEALALARDGSPEFHGFFIARALKEHGNTKALTAYGTLYKALDRLERAGLLESRWEDQLAVAGTNRPRRRLYRVTAAGEAALVAAAAPSGAPAADAVRP